MNVKTVLTLFLLVLKISTARGQEVLFTLKGEPLGGGFGASVSEFGDVNSDNIPDFIACAYSVIEENYNGRVNVFSGLDGSLLYKIDGEDREGLGASVCGIEDINLDGSPDFLVGSDDSVSGSKGSAKVISGADGSILYKLTGDDEHEGFGLSLSGIGDVNSDGISDFIIGAPRKGYVRVYSGADGLLLYKIDGSSASFGSSISGIGDVNSDGVPDLVVGKTSDDNFRGSAKVFSGRDGSVKYTVYGDSEEDTFGRSVSKIGDVNKDGIPDFIVGASRDDNTYAESGSVRLVSGVDGSELYTVNGHFEWDQFGHSLSGIGDVNFDGTPDFIVGVLHFNLRESAGNAHVFSGKDGSPLYSIYGDSPGDLFGYKVIGIGDVNSDGVHDFAVGAPNGGYVKVFSGASVQRVQEWYQHP